MSIDQNIAKNYVLQLAERDKIIIKHRKIVFWTIKNVLGAWALRDEDLIAAGIEGLVQAANRYRQDMNAAFSTYAFFWIKKCIIEETRQQMKQRKIASLFAEPDITDKETPENIIARKELFEKLADIIERLPAKTSHKVVLHAHLVESETLTAAGAAANVSAALVKKLVERHRKRICKQLSLSA